MAPTLYMVYPSPPVRAVLITAKAIGLELELKELNLTEGDHLKPEFLKINPQHTVPTLVEEDGSVIWDSHAIMTYLISKYGQHKESLYPKELLKRAIVDQRLHFESGIAFPRMLQIAGPIMRKGKTSIEPDDVKLAHEVYAFLEKFLDGKKWIAGSHITVADYSLISTISTLDLFVSVEENIFPKVKTWMKKMESLGEYEANRKGLEMSRETIESKLTKKQSTNKSNLMVPSIVNVQLSPTLHTVKMAPKLYMIPYSQPVRATLMTIKALNLDVELVEVNLLNREQFSSNYTKLNPQHSVPTLVEEDGFVLWDSHAIMAYLVDKYGKDDSLYPKELQARAIVTQRLHFENGILFPRTMDIIRPVIYQGVKTVSSAQIEAVKEAYNFLEKFLEGNEWVAGKSVTVADFSIISSITTMDVVVPIDAKAYPNIYSWIKRCEKLPYYNLNKKGLDEIRVLIERNLK
ncbi:uncharacterized protein LOC123014840 [Tribolium madens]|uniref:uncharacterized protein LOC123014840 n=1 Tax=Tribolium madens TaxID=41895 RepID=UPI001CF76683|nr:uncharacterized protein LOC123014840 [Tribolium madens]